MFGIQIVDAARRALELVSACNPYAVAPLPKHRDTTGYLRPLGYTPPAPGTLRLFDAPLGDFSVPEVPQSEWVEFDLTADLTYPLVIKDQDQRGACNGFATAESMELARWLHGLPYVPLSGWWVYANLCGGIDRGSSIGDALGLIQKNGIAPDADVAYGIINPHKLTDQATTDAKNYTAEISAPLLTWEQIMSAVQLKLGGINLSIRCGGSFEPDDGGVVNVTRGAGNHAITAGHGARKVTAGRYKGQWAIKWQNHWTDQWGLKGYAWYVQDHWDLQSYAEAYVVRTPAAGPSPVAPVAA